MIMLRVVEEAGGNPFGALVKCVIGVQMLTVTQVSLKRTCRLWVLHLQNVTQWVFLAVMMNTMSIYLAMVRSYEEKLVTAAYGLFKLYKIRFS